MSFSSQLYSQNVKLSLKIFKQADSFSCVHSPGKRWTPLRAPPSNHHHCHGHTGVIYIFIVSQLQQVFKVQALTLRHVLLVCRAESRLALLLPHTEYTQCYSPFFKRKKKVYISISLPVKSVFLKSSATFVFMSPSQKVESRLSEGFHLH